MKIQSSGTGAPHPAEAALDEELAHIARTAVARLPLKGASA